MATYVPAKINTAYITYVGLTSKANASILQANPTLAGGDVKVATDDGAPGNLATLPVVDGDFTKRVKVSLSAAEMNGGNVTVIFSDAAGDEWCDLILNIQTAANQIDDLNTVVPDAAGTAPTAVEIQAEMEENGASILDTLRDDLADGGRLDAILDELTTQGDTNETKLDTVITDTGTTLDNHLTDIKGTGFVKDTHSLVDIEAYADLIDDGTSGLAKIATDVAAVLVDTGTTIPATITTAQADLDTITGTGGVLIGTDAMDRSGTLDVNTKTLSNIDFGATMKASINTEVDTALSDINLDHLAKVADADDVVDNSIIAKLAASGATADWSTFVNTTDSLQATRDHIADGTNLTEAGGDGDHLTAINLPNQTMDITGDITGNISGSVGSCAAATVSAIGANVITAASIAAGAIDNATFAADVGSTAYATNIIGLATRKAIDDYDPPTKAELDTAQGAVTVAAIDNIDFGATMKASINTEADNAFATYDPPTKTEMDSAFTEIKGATWAAGTDTLEHIRNKQTDIETDTQAIETDTQDIQSRLPAALSSGNIKADVLAISTSTAAADNLEASAETIITGTATTGTLSVTRMTTDLSPSVAEQYNGRIIIFKEDTTTAALQGQATDITSTIVANGELVFTQITTAPVNGDTFNIV